MRHRISILIGLDRYLGQNTAESSDVRGQSHGESRQHNAAEEIQGIFGTYRKASL